MAVTEVEDLGFGISSITMKDNSIGSVTTPTVLNLLPSLHPIFSSDGIDNKIVPFNSSQTLLEQYGSDLFDMNKYGQQNLNARQVLAAGGTAYVCRLMSEDAKYAHGILKLAVKENADIQLYKRDSRGYFLISEDGQKEKMTVMVDPDGEGVQPAAPQDAKISGIEFKVIFEPVAKQDENKPIRQLKTLYSKVTDGAEDLLGYKIIPLMFVSYYAKGICGENYGLRIINDFVRDEKVNDGRRFMLYLLKKTKTGAVTLSIGNALSFSFNPNATISTTILTSESLQKVYKNIDQNSNDKQIQIEYYSDNYEALKNEVETILGQEMTVTEGVDKESLKLVQSMEDLDFLFGTNKDGLPCDNITFTEGSINIGNPQYLKSGSDGKMGTLTGDNLQNERNELLKKFFAGDIDQPTFMDVLKCDAGIVYDANYPIEIKQSMIGIVNYRRDMCVVLDCGETDSLDSAIAVSKSLRNLISKASENFAIIPHFGTTVDDTVDRRVSGTYEFAYDLTNRYRISPFSIIAGKQEEAGCVKRMVFDWVVGESKPLGYNDKLARQNKLLYAIDFGLSVSTPAPGNMTGKNIYWFSNSSLYNVDVSKLTEFRNGIIINDIRRMLKLVLVKYTFDSAGAEKAIAKANTELSKVFSERYPTNIVITVDMFQTDRDKLINQATCNVGVLFPDVFETWNCTIEVNRSGVTEV